MPTVETTMKVYESSDNGQIACEEHRAMYGSIPWREMPAIEQAAFRAELADIIKPSDSLCEVCRGNARRARAEAARWRPASSGSPRRMPASSASF